MNPLVSVIIPVYKTEKYLAQCMDSVLNQTYRNLEIILVDDGSPDNCPALCDGYAQHDSRVKVIHRQNGGLSAARNTGKAAATGAYLTFLDSDDILAPEAVACMVELAQKEQAKLVKVGIARKTDIADCVPRYKGYTVTTGVKVLHTIYKSSPQIVSSCGKLYDATLLQSVEFPEGMYYEDEYTAPRIYCLAEKVVLCESELYFYMQRDNDSIIRSTLNEKKIHDTLFVTEDRITFFQKQGFRKLTTDAVKDHYLNLCKLIRETEKSPALATTHKDLLERRKTFIQQHRIATGVEKLRQTASKLKTRVLRGRKIR